MNKRTKEYIDSINHTKYRLYFAFDAEVFDLKHVSKTLDITPTHTRIKANPSPQYSSWQFEMEPSKHWNMKPTIAKMLDIFEPKVALIRLLKEKYSLQSRLQFVLHLDFNPEIPTPCFSFSNRLIQFLADTETEVDFDLYKYAQ